MKLLFLDLETTGLAVDAAILEVGAIAVDGERLIGHFHRRVSQPPQVLEAMEPFVREMHEKSGLLAELKRDAMPMQTVGFELAEFIGKHWAKDEDKPRLAGYSVHVDKRWLESAAPAVAALMHHRVLDVSSLRDTLKDMGLEFAKNDVHRAIADCEDSIRAYQTFRKILAVGVAVWRVAG
jgi:oligoribonuclease